MAMLLRYQHKNTKNYNHFVLCRWLVCSCFPFVVVSIEFLSRMKRKIIGTEGIEESGTKQPKPTHIFGKRSNMSEKSSTGPSRESSTEPSIPSSREPSLGPSRRSSRVPSINLSEESSVTISAGPSRETSLAPSDGSSRPASAAPSREPSIGPSEVTYRTASGAPSRRSSRVVSFGSVSLFPSEGTSRASSAGPSRRSSREMSSGGTSEKRSKSGTKTRTFNRIPIFLVDYHNHVLEFIYRCLGSRHLEFSNNTLIHFDSHPDMVIARDMEAKTVYNKSKLLDELSIENWIMPTLYAGHFKKLIWIKNTWCNQIPKGIHHFAIGEYNDKIRVSLAIDYFISEGNYCDESLLKNTNKIILEVLDAGENSQILLSNDNCVLDIDLDFFSCTNPFLKIYGEVDVYERLKGIFEYPFGDSEDRTELSNMRGALLDNLEEIFKHLHTHRNLTEYKNDQIPNRIYEKIDNLKTELLMNYEDSEIDWLLINDAGCTCDNNGLPHHISTEPELEQYYTFFDNFIRNLPTRPILITMARSAEDNYCPQNQVDRIQARVIQILRRFYRERLNENPILHYKNNLWDVMHL